MFKNTGDFWANESVTVIERLLIRRCIKHMTSWLLFQSTSESSLSFPNRYFLGSKDISKDIIFC